MSKENFQLIGSPNRALLAATLGFFFGAMSISLFGPTAKALTDVMGLTPAEVGLLVAVPSLSGSLLRIPFGVSVDVNGGRKSFNFLMLCSAIGLIGLSILFSTRFPENMAGLYPVILLLGCLAGCGIATFSVGVSQISYWFRKKDQGFALGVFGGLGTASAGVLAFCLPLLLKGIGFVNAYHVLTAVLIIGGILYAVISCNAPYFQLRNHGVSHEEAKEAAVEHGEELFPTGNIVESLKISAGIPQTWLLVLTYFTTFGGFMALTAWFPTYWTRAQGLEPITAGALTAIFSILAALMRVPGGKFADKVGGQKVCIGALVVVAISCALMNLNLPWFGTFLITIVIAVAFGFNNAAVMKLVPVYVAKSVGGASGWVGGLGAFGGFVFPIILAAVVTAYGNAGYGLGFLVFTLFAIANIVLNWLGMMRKAN